MTNKKKRKKKENYKMVNRIAQYRMIYRRHTGHIQYC